MIQNLEAWLQESSERPRTFEWQREPTRLVSLGRTPNGFACTLHESCANPIVAEGFTMNAAISMALDQYRALHSNEAR